MPKITDTAYPALSSPASADLLWITDVSDTTESAEGSTKKITFTDLTADLGGGGTLSGGTLTGYLAPAVTDLSESGSDVAVNAALGNDFRLTLTASGWTISNPSNPVDGQDIVIRLEQDATGGWTVSWDTAYSFAAIGGSAPVPLTAAGAVTYTGFKYVEASSAWECTGATGQSGTGALALQATTATAHSGGYSLADSTGAVISWTAPDDGQPHRFTTFASLTVTSAETGGEIDVSWTTPDGTGSIAGQVIYDASLGTTGAHGGSPYSQVIEAGSTVTVSQSTALTAGAAKLWAEIWGS